MSAHYREKYNQAQFCCENKLLLQNSVWQMQAYDEYRGLMDDLSKADQFTYQVPYMEMELLATGGINYRTKITFIEIV